MPVALGFRVHTGWAAAVAVDVEGGRVVGKRRITMIADLGEAEAYHRGREVALADAERIVAETERKAADAARGALLDFVEAVGAETGEKVVAVGIVDGSGRLPETLSGVLRSNAMVHGAEGDLYRRALALAAEAAGLPVVRVPSRELVPRTAEALGRDVRGWLAEIGGTTDRPWGQDGKESAMAARVAAQAVLKG